jgi:hypothetical protein
MALGVFVVVTCVVSIRIRLGGPAPRSPARTVSGEGSSDSFGWISVRSINSGHVELQAYYQKTLDFDHCRTHMWKNLPYKECIFPFNLSPWKT